MKIKTVELEKVAVEKKAYPKEILHEFAFVGRSNVGKSSFINAMIERKKLARTSSKPGKTRTINFYKINDNIRFVDLPGYGYAAVSKTEKAKWANIINEYLYERENLLEVFLLVDIRHKPTQLDIQMYKLIKESGYVGMVIATKSDKISKNEIRKNIKIIEKTLEVEDADYIIPFSSEKKDAVEFTWNVIEDLIEYHK